MSPILEYLSRTLPAFLHRVAHSDAIDWRQLVLAFSTAQWLFESYLTRVLSAAGSSLLTPLLLGARPLVGSLSLGTGRLTYLMNYPFDSARLRQIPLYSKPPPADLVKDQTPEEIAKSQAYGRDKALFSLANGTFDFICGAALLWFDGFSRVWVWSGDLLGPERSGGVSPGDGDQRGPCSRLTPRLTARQSGLLQAQIAQSLLFPTLLTLLMSLPGYLPALYQTFVIEARHGFNKSTLGLWIADKLKEQLLFAALGLPLLAGFLKIMDWAGDSFVGYLMLFLCVAASCDDRLCHCAALTSPLPPLSIVVQLFLATIFPTFIQPLFNKFTSLPAGPVRTKVEALAAKLRFPLTHLYEIDGSKRSSHSNACVFPLDYLVG
jgi:STE24 endopeptidase